MDTLFEIFKIAFPPTAIVAGVVYLLRKYIDNRFARGLESFKLDLQLESEKSKMQFQTTLQAQLFEFQTKFSLFHQKQAEIVAELYKLLSDVCAEISQLTAPLQFEDRTPLADKKKKVANSFNDLSTFFSRHRIYFSVQICEKVDAVLKHMRDALIDFDTAHTFGMQSSDTYKPDQTGLWVKAWKTLDKQIPPLMKELETYFKRILSGDLAQTVGGSS